ncbi:MAG TPA: hypothetical protein VMY87_12085, partial [Armatimonadota bacterium]|nr:hypothetical protein [Armatimonadota bacterium]
RQGDREVREDGRAEEVDWPLLTRSQAAVCPASDVAGQASCGGVSQVARLRSDGQATEDGR